jgi:multimeric flavodoxin WrbA
MTKRLTIVGLGGSLAKTSRSRAALRMALEGAASAGAETTILDLRELALPMYNPDDDEPTAAAERLIESATAPTECSGAARCTRERSRARSRMRSTGCTCSARASLPSYTTP